MADTVAEQLSKEVQRLPEADQRRVLDFARAIRRETPVGVPGKSLLRFARSIPESNLKEMAEAIERDCESIDPRDW